MDAWRRHSCKPCTLSDACSLTDSVDTINGGWMEAEGFRRCGAKEEVQICTAPLNGVSLGKWFRYLILLPSWLLFDRPFAKNNADLSSG